MKLICDGKDLSDAVGKAGKALGQRTLSNPLLENIKLEATPGTLTISATDSELSISASIVADVKSEGSVLVPGKLFSEFTRRLASERIELLIAAGKLVLRYGQSSGELTCSSSEDYPENKEMPEAQSFVICSKDLKDLIGKVAFCASADNARPILKGVYIEIAEEGITAVALDSFRMAKCTKSIEKTTAQKSIIVPARSLSEIARLLSDSEDSVTVYTGRGSIRVDIGHTVITSALIDGDYVNYRALIPPSFATKVTIPSQPLNNALERAMLLSKSENSNPVKFDITERLFELTSISDAGVLNEKIQIIMEGPDLTIAFNAKYFVEMLRVINGDAIKVQMNTPQAPCIVEPASGEEDYLYLILPIKMN